VLPEGAEGGSSGGSAYVPAYVQSNRYELEVNGTRRTVEDAWLGESLLFVLRERLGLPGSKNACEQGECGSCSVLLDGVIVCACLVLAVDAIDSKVETVEGLSATQQVSDVQAALVENGAVQCGFCTPGFVVAVHDLLARSPDAGEMEVREALSGNLCRCTGYGRIFEAVRDVQRQRAVLRAASEAASNGESDVGTVP
jgi:aerobic carbon-monoxide dehydrogenase small subunit